MSSLGDFNATIDRFIADKIRGREDKLVRNVMFEIAENVIVGGEFSPGTPVDTGFARESWYISLDGVTANPAPGVLAGGQNALDQATLRLLGVKAGGVVYILNNASYIRPLEYGSSKQAPQGMVRMTLGSGQQLVSKVARQMSK